MFSARFDKLDENRQVLNEIELYINLSIIGNITESGFDIYDVGSQLEQQIQNQESKDSGWRFDKTNSRTIYFSRTTTIDGSKYVKIPLRRSAVLKMLKMLMNIGSFGQN